MNITPKNEVTAEAKSLIGKVTEYGAHKMDSNNAVITRLSICKIFPKINTSKKHSAKETANDTTQITGFSLAVTVIYREMILPPNLINAVFETYRRTYFRI